MVISSKYFSINVLYKYLIYSLMLAFIAYNIMSLIRTNSMLDDEIIMIKKCTCIKITKTIS